MNDGLREEILADNGIGGCNCNECLCHTCGYMIDGSLCFGNCYKGPYECMTFFCEQYVKRKD